MHLPLPRHRPSPGLSRAHSIPVAQRPDEPGTLVYPAALLLVEDMNRGRRLSAVEADRYYESVDQERDAAVLLTAAELFRRSHRRPSPRQLAAALIVLGAGLGVAVAAAMAPDRELPASATVVQAAILAIVAFGAAWVAVTIGAMVRVTATLRDAREVSGRLARRHPRAASTALWLSQFHVQRAPSRRR